MAKSTGMAMTVFSVTDLIPTARDIKNDITNFTFSTPRGVQDITGLDKSAKETLLLLADMSGTVNVVFNPTATTSSHAVFSTVPASTNVGRAMVITFGSTPAATMSATCNFTDYPLTRSNAGELTAAVPFVLQNGTAPVWS